MRNAPFSRRPRTLKSVARYFTLRQAEDLIPEVERHLRNALFHKAEFQSAHKEWEDKQDRIRMSGGMRVNPGALLALRARRDASVTALKSALAEIEKAGVLVKDLDIGLIDFMTLYQGREVCLCWKLGEDGIHFWHGEDEGFRGRKPIDEDFLKHHSTEDGNTH
jgi:hypothetical protein